MSTTVYADWQRCAYYFPNRRSAVAPNSYFCTPYTHTHSHTTHSAIELQCQWYLTSDLPLLRHLLKQKTTLICDSFRMIYCTVTIPKYAFQVACLRMKGDDLGFCLQQKISIPMVLTARTSPLPVYVITTKKQQQPNTTTSYKKIPYSIPHEKRREMFGEMVFFSSIF